MKIDWIFRALPRRPEPTECPDCGSNSIAPIQYGYPGQEMLEAVRSGEILLGGCMITSESPQWFCKNCLLSWPEKSPVADPYDEQDRRLIRMTGNALQYVSLKLESWWCRKKGEPEIENDWRRTDGRRIFLVKFPWGKLRIEKRLSPTPFGEIPEYEVVGGLPPRDVDDRRSLHLAKLAAIRFERQRIA